MRPLADLEAPVSVSRPLIVVALVLSLAGGAPAKPLVAGERYTGPVKIDAPGAAFTLPAGWTGVLPPGDEWFHIGKDGENGRVFLFAGQMSRAQAKQALASGFPVAGAVMLSPTSAPRREGKALVADFSANDGMGQYAAMARVRSDDKSGMSFAAVAVAPPGELGRYAKLARTIERGIRFRALPKAKAKAKAAGGPGKGRWARALANHRVVKFHHGSGYSEKTQLVLCGDGRFERSFGATSVSGIGTGVASAGNAGRWSVQGDVLTLRYNDGDVASVRLEDRGGKLFVDGERWLREPFACR